jgi:hypothetical protein
MRKFIFAEKESTGFSGSNQRASYGIESNLLTGIPNKEGGKEKTVGNMTYIPTQAYYIVTMPVSDMKIVIEYTNAKEE